MSSSSSSDSDSEGLEGNYTIIESGPTSTIARTWAAIGTAQPQLVAVKQASYERHATRRPHDILKEIDILRNIDHPHVIPVLDVLDDSIAKYIQFWMPYLPYSLADLLASPRCTEYLFSSTELRPVDTMTLCPSLDQKIRDEIIQKASDKSDVFPRICQSIMFQILLAVQFIHDEVKIAHRDIKPSNILMTMTGWIRLIDFGVSYRDSKKWEPGSAQMTKPMWPESYEDNTMYFEVCTGAYRAPELLFGCRQYDPYAVDIWSLGALFAEFFRPLRLYIGEDDDYEAPEENDSSPADPPNKPLERFILPPGMKSCKKKDYKNFRWIRETLFNGTRGELGLAWSIFKVKGTPTETTWPGFDKLPHAGGVCFTFVPGVPLEPLLPNIPRMEAITPDYVPNVLDFIQKHLAYVPSERIKPADAMKHPYFDPYVVVPEDYPSQNQYQASLRLTHIGAHSHPVTFGDILRGLIDEHDQVSLM